MRTKLRLSNSYKVKLTGAPIYLQNKNRTATCFCHTILEFAAAEKSLDLYGHKIGINSSWILVNQRFTVDRRIDAAGDAFRGLEQQDVWAAFCMAAAAAGAKVRR
jgi:hypothetical protein